jgi:phosphatidylglycerophosphate synthase
LRLYATGKAFWQLEDYWSKEFSLVPPLGRLTAGSRLRFSRGGGTFTVVVNQYIGSKLARAAIKLNLHPNYVTLLSGLVGVAGSALTILFLLDGQPKVAALTALVTWHLAYSLDCADGQVARETGNMSPRGAVLDLLVDFVGHTSIAIALLVGTTGTVSGLFRDLYAVMVGTAFVIAPYFEGVYKALPKDLQMPERIGYGKLVWLLRDHGLHVTLLPVAIMLGPVYLAWTTGAISVLEYVALFARIGTFSKT